MEMALRSSISRSLLAAARSSARPMPPVSLSGRPSLSTIRFQQQGKGRLLNLFPAPRNLAELGCVMSLLPLHDVVAATCLASHLSANARACCEIFPGRNGKDG